MYERSIQNILNLLKIPLSFRILPYPIRHEKQTQTNSAKRCARCY